MLLILFTYLTSLGWKIPAAFSYSSTRMMLAALTALLVTIFLGPRCIKRLYELKTGQSIRVEDCPMLAQLHEKKKNTPSMGGVLILFSIFIALLFWMDLTNVFTVIFLLTIFWLGGIGAYDDYLKLKYKNSKGLNGKKKLLAQIAFAAAIGIYGMVPGIAENCQVGKELIPPTAKEQIQSVAPVQLSTSEYMTQYYIPFLKDPVIQLTGGLTILGILITIFVITGSSNAVNLTDGLDGLAAGCVVLVAGVLALVAFFSNNIEMSRYLNILYIEGAGEIAVFLSATMGACLGFLWFNGYPAQVFMGDTGSLALGGILGVAAVLLRREVLLALVGGIFVAETLSVILQVASYKLRDKKRIFLCAPLHHHFEYKGWPETKVVLRFWIVGLLLAVIGAISLKIQ
ncbi:MAG TPA: phospho-N-acetylmuramoyl-pentapeptide-transferase [Rhabdochlamydiaceae bacterium]|nr:phospho-N-acetylmuramoyl-pentapeptide-transferase [Rhabdochlamydiaceae bacterium]